jgi:NAD(P)-dependent dehydrogenase (short-subunit alcohol dehydrogenase family)
MNETILSDSEFRDAAVVLIGGHLGVGPALVRAFAERGARIAIGVLAHQAPDAAQRQACDLPGVATIDLDPAEPGAVGAFYDRCEASLGGLAVVVNVAPPVKTRAALEIPVDEYRRVVEAELIGPVQCMLEAGRRMAARGAGRIISFSSMSGKTGVHRQVAPYAAAKGGLIAFSRVLAAELAPTGVTVNVIATALFDVQVAGGSEQLAEVVKGIPVGRVGRSSEAAQAVLYLASREAGYVTGETLNLSGGRFMD